MNFIWKYLRDYKKEAVLGPLFKWIEALFELLVPVVMVSLIDVGIKNGDFSYVWKMVALLLLFAVFGCIFSVIAQRFSAKAAMGFGENLRRDLFQHILGFSYTNLDSVGTATLISRVTDDVTQVQSGVNLTLRLLLRSPFILLGAIFIAYTVHVRSAIFFSILIPVLLLIILGMMGRTIPLFSRVQAGLDRILLLVRENMEGLRVIRAFRKQDQQKEKFDQANEELTHRKERVAILNSTLMPLTYVLMNLGVVLLVWRGANLVQIGEMTQGQIVALTNLMAQILVELFKFSRLIIQLNRALSGKKRIEQVFAVSSELEDGEEDFPEDFQSLRFDDVSFHYAQASEESLQDIDFEVASGMQIGVLGGTGSGKTTLIHLIQRFYDPSTGKVCVNDLDLRKLRIESLRAHIAYVPQKAKLFSGTVRDNLLWGREDATDEELYEALDIAEAKDFVLAKEGLDTEVLAGGRNFSGGQRQRLTIARAMVRKPDILILDDSASALDYLTAAKVLYKIRTRAGHLTSFIVSQRVSHVKHCDLILVLDHGKLVAQGKHEELMDTSQVYREMYASQNEGGKR